jgi:hypothetical protein
MAKTNPAILLRKKELLVHPDQLFVPCDRMIAAFEALAHA